MPASKKEAIKKMLFTRLHWLVWIIAITASSLTSAYIIGVKAIGAAVFAGRIVFEVPVPTCNNPKTCAACAPCKCGPFARKYIAFEFGREARSIPTLCQAVSALPMGNGGLIVGSVVLGKCPTLDFTDNATCDVWSMHQASSDKPWKIAFSHSKIPSEQFKNIR